MTKKGYATKFKIFRKKIQCTPIKKLFSSVFREKILLDKKCSKFRSLHNNDKERRTQNAAGVQERAKKQKNFLALASF